MAGTIGVHPFISRMTDEWALEPCGDECGPIPYGMTWIGRGHSLRVATMTGRTTREAIRYMSHNPDCLIVMLNEDGGVDLKIYPAFGDGPVTAYGVPWRESGEFWKLGKSDTAAEFAFELDRLFGRRRLEARFVREFEAYRSKLAKSWSGIDSNDVEIRNRLALHTMLRILFLCFIEAIGALDARITFLREEAEKCESAGAGIYSEFLQNLFFNTLNKPVSRRKAKSLSFGNVPFLNGGLFTPNEDEKSNPSLDAPNALMSEMINKLFGKYNFGFGRENGVQSFDPLLLGHVFESLMDGERRKNTGSFYTPMPVARSIASDAIALFLSDRCGLSMDTAQELVSNSIDNPTMRPEEASRVDGLMDKITILDPAAGSGAFLQASLEVIHRVRTKLQSVTGRRDPSGMLAKRILANNLFGIDIQPEASELCSLRLWLEILRYFGSDERLQALPNIDLNIMCGDALADLSQYRRAMNLEPECADEHVDACLELSRKYRMSTGSTKRRLADAIGRHTKAASDALVDSMLEACEREQLDIRNRARSLLSPGGRQYTFKQNKELSLVEKRREHLMGWRKGDGVMPGFSFDLYFGEAMSRGGFDIVLGNPPWMSLHTMPAELQDVLKSLYATASTGARCTELASLFVEKSVQCAKDGGIVAMLVPNKLMYAPTYEGFRKYISRNVDVITRHEYCDSGRMFDACTYPMEMVLKKTDPTKSALPPQVRHSSRLEYRHPAGVAAHTFSDIPQQIGQFWSVRRGVCTGANDIFVGRRQDPPQQEPGTTDPENTSPVAFGRNEHATPIETKLIHPIVRGKSIRPFKADTDQVILFTHNWPKASVPLSALPPLADKYLRTAFAGRTEPKRTPTDGRPKYNMAGANDNLPSMKVVWRDISCDIEACFIKDMDVIPLNTAYYIPVDSEEDGYLLSAYLNSTPVREFCRKIAEHAQSGYRRYMAWVINRVPWVFGERRDEATRRMSSLSKLCHESAADAEISAARAKIDEIVRSSIDAFVKSRLLAA